MKPIVLRCFLKVEEEYFVLRLQFWQFYYDRLSNNKSFYLVASLSKLSRTLSSILMSTNCTCHRWYPGISIHFKVSMVTRPNCKDNFSHESDSSERISNDMMLGWRHSRKEKMMCPLGMKQARFETFCRFHDMRRQKKHKAPKVFEWDTHLRGR